MESQVNTEQIFLSEIPAGRAIILCNKNNDRLF